MISSDEFAAYNRAVARIGDKAASDVEESIMGWCREHESATVAEKREAAKLIMDGYIQGYDDIAAEFAAEWYDHRAEKSGIKLASVVDGFAGTPTFWRLNGLDDDEVRNVMSEIRRNVTRSAAFDLISGASQDQAKMAAADD